MRETKGTTIEPQTILIVDDHPVFRHGLAKLIEREPDIAVCGEAESAAEALKLIPKLNPSLVLVDLSLNGTPGLELVKEIHAHHPETRVLVVSMHDEVLWAERALRAGSKGYVMKQEKPRSMMLAIRQTLRGETWLSPQTTNLLIGKLTRSRGNTANPEDSLGDRELQVLQLLGEGMSTKEIATALSVSVKTIDAHREHIKHKLALDNSTDLIRYAVLRFLGEKPTTRAN